MYVVLGASGNTGSVVAKTLLAKGEKVRAISRSKNHLSALTNLGAEAFEADQTDSSHLSKAFEGARAVYFMIPPDPTSSDYRAYQQRIVESAAKALEAAGIRHVVALSSYGADQESGTGPVLGLHHMESRFGEISGLNALYLRAGYFMENTLPQVTVIQNMGIVAGPLRADLASPMIASRDIGAAAADALFKLDFSGQQIRELQGARDVTYPEATRIIGNAIGKTDLQYKQLPKEIFIQAVTQMGMSANFASLVGEMCDALNDQRMRMLDKRSTANTTPTSFETFVQEVFVPAYRGKAAGA